MIRRFTILLSIGLLLVLSACGGTSSNTNDATSKNETADAGITAKEELIITAANYSFDQKTYHLKKGVPVKIIFKNESGNHGILIPELNLRLDGKDASRVIVPDEAGTFEMTCAIMCGSGHSGMSAQVIVE
ncbi:cytochrome C oxidase subunit II [Paenibacillus sp. P3E]|uniref:cupredoxin domain-containing protein n=1 Tax=Paenibacillus sp. P3E TaxID=1349435 RepID=UPI00093BD331|nr:cupredoxin domain-containing protein [Paenibacillus sp. P3E]OKP71899.1 cytochrome C oxidase subunit II [Paenibacillus sp. P3E]